jgi:hypothetical protein
MEDSKVQEVMRLVEAYAVRRINHAALILYKYASPEGKLQAAREVDAAEKNLREYLQKL